MRPAAHEFPAYYEQYVDQVEEDDVMSTLDGQREEMAAFAAVLDDDRARYRYEDGKWSIKEVIGHLLDAERIFGTRALCIARGEEQPIPGFDENTYVANALFDKRPLKSIMDEWFHLRDANICLFASLSEEDVSRIGIANGKPITPRAIIWTIAGHTVHHLRILRERYGVS
ncbi:MAG: DinB family protein [Ignavibacteria bacterium]|nr:DinB family protein [Ignavibacteria bacterium]MBP7093534.1 DinB family protein [Candidatus Kapabacteria bacterium]MBK6419645.1 DinB family protein [Ignavibacteria bacterium]MBK6759725.1 DinB family protein [Ignavibacteria bacterium]MBK7033085.1 DinB family protein [Ignavibacteria bacterium]